MLAFVKALSKEEHKRNLDADAKLATLASKLSEDILDGVILESLNYGGCFRRSYDYNVVHNRN